MRVAVIVCIYDRFDNLRRWIHAWRLCPKSNNEQLVIIHNQNTIRAAPNQYERYCRRHGVTYIKRQNIGFETGVIQDVLLNRIKLDWDCLLFATDDTLPIKRDFIKHYINEVSKPDVGVACMEISGVWTPHIRTTGWCARREITDRIQWVYNPITDKEQCYFFEHAGYEDTMMSQVLKMDKRVVQLSNIRESVMWDTHHHEDHNRWEEWNREFPNFS